MTKKQYLKSLNQEIQKLNGIIDDKIMHQADYKRESRRHKNLLQQLRREGRNRSLLSALGLNFLSRV